MIKFIVFCTKILVAAVVAVLFSSCKYQMGIEGNGNVTKEKRIISDKFTKVEVSHGIELIVEQGENIMVEVETDQNLQKQLITKVENGTLIVKFEGSINNTSAETVRIRMPKIEGISADSGAEVTSKNTLLGNTTIKLDADSGSNIDVVLEYDAIEPVSYTHLDVYKRQSLRCFNSCFFFYFIIICFNSFRCDVVFIINAR